LGKNINAKSSLVTLANNMWVCSKCGFTSETKLDKCPKCGGTSWKETKEPIMKARKIPVFKSRR
jgi:rubrerythrin